MLEILQKLGFEPIDDCFTLDNVVVYELDGGESYLVSVMSGYSVDYNVKIDAVNWPDSLIEHVLMGVLK